MAKEATNLDVSDVTNELDDAIATLDAALLQAGRSVAIIRSSMAQFASLAEKAREMETAMARAREQLSLSWAATQPVAPTTPLRPVPPTQSYEQEPEPAPEIEPQDQFETYPSPATEQELPQDEPVDEAPEPSSGESRCLRLTVSSKAGSLDLKAVDGSVNENPAVVDVALLDYDGRRATLKLWVNENADPNGVRDALLSSLRRHLGERDAELSIDFEEGSAA